LKDCSDIRSVTSRWSRPPDDPHGGAAPVDEYLRGTAITGRWLNALLGPAGSKTGVSYPGGLPATDAEVDNLIRDVGFRPAAPTEIGV
jgi:hypothetical protein